MNTINLITTFNEQPDGTPQTLLRLQNGVMPDIAALLHEAGYSHMQYDSDHSTFRGRFEDKPCLVMFAAPAGTPMEINTLSETQCKWAEENYPRHDIFWTTLCLEGKDFLFFAPVRVREDGVWLHDDDETGQYLPSSLSSPGSCVANAALGGAYVFKLTQLLIRHLAQNGKKPTFTVTHLFESLHPDEPYAVLHCSGQPCWMLLLEKEKEQYCVNRPIFYNCSPPYSKLELLNIREEYPWLGLVELLHADGRTYVAECAEAVILRKQLPLQRCYQWALSMVAETVTPTVKEISIKEGPLFEMEKEKYREEHGTEPPADFAVRVSLQEMRTIIQHEESGEYAASCSLCGVIRGLEDITLSPLEFPGGHCLRALVSCFADEEEETLVSVFLPPTVLNGYTPAVGDNISCTGTLLATPDELCEESESLQDSAEVAAAEYSRDRALEASRVLHEFEECSLGLGIAAAAFVDGGWQIEHADAGIFSRRHLPLAVANQQGKLAVVFVDTVVNGRQPAHPITEYRDRIEQHYLGEQALAQVCHFCTVNLDYVEAADRYKVSMTIDPPCEGVENRFVMVSPGNRQSIPCFGKEDTEQLPLPPAELDETLAARLFRDAMAEGKWAEYAKWIREEVEYTSGTINSSEHSKEDYLRYMTERVEDWKSGPYARWPYFRFSVGTVLYQGKRRPCTATYYVGILSAVVVFDDDKGLIGKIHTLPRKHYCTYIEEEKPRNTNGLKRSELRAPVRDVKRPPYAATQPVQIGCFPHDTEHRRILRAVLKYLEKLGTPAVGNPTAQAPLPHIWFRGKEMNLCYVIFGPVDAAEAPQAQRLQQLKEWVGLLEYEHLKQLCHYQGYMAYVNNDGEVTLREIPELS